MTPHSTDSLCPALGNAPDAENVEPPSAECGSLGSEATTAECSAPNPSTLAQLIESERVELLQVQAMLKCLYEVLLYADDDDSVMHADVANVCARLIDDSASRLGELLMKGAESSSGRESSESELSKSCGSEE
jgi:hypothetical protein